MLSYRLRDFLYPIKVSEKRSRRANCANIFPTKSGVKLTLKENTSVSLVNLI